MKLAEFGGRKKLARAPAKDLPRSLDGHWSKLSRPGSAARHQSEHKIGDSVKRVWGSEKSVVDAEKNDGQPQDLRTKG